MHQNRKEYTVHENVLLSIEYVDILVIKAAIYPDFSFFLIHKKKREKKRNTLVNATKIIHI